MIKHTSELNWYSTSLEHRINNLRIMHNERPNTDIKALMDDISDGCGGCERMMYATPEGNEGWVSVLGEQDHQTYYAFIEVGTNYPSDTAEHVKAAHWGTYPGVPMIGNVATDSVLVYAGFMDMMLGGYEEMAVLDEDYGYNPFTVAGVQTVHVHSSMGDAWEISESNLDISRWCHDVVTNQVHFTTDIEVAYYGYDPRVMSIPAWGEPTGHMIGTEGMPDATGRWNPRTERIDWEAC